MNPGTWTKAHTTNVVRKARDPTVRISCAGQILENVCRSIDCTTAISCGFLHFLISKILKWSLAKSSARTTRISRVCQLHSCEIRLIKLCVSKEVTWKEYPTCSGPPANQWKSPTLNLYLIKQSQTRGLCNRQNDHKRSSGTTRQLESRLCLCLPSLWRVIHVPLSCHLGAIHSSDPVWCRSWVGQHAKIGAKWCKYV